MSEWIRAFYQRAFKRRLALCRSRQIDVSLRHYSSLRRQQATILLLGRNTRELMQGLKRCLISVLNEDQLFLQDPTLCCFRDQLVCMYIALQESDLGVNALHDAYQQAFGLEGSHKIPAEIDSARLNVLRSCICELIVSLAKGYPDDAAKLFMSAVEKLFYTKGMMYNDYISSMISEQRSRSRGPDVLDLVRPIRQLRIVDIKGVLGDRRKWMHVFERNSVIIVTADLSEYDGSPVPGHGSLFDDISVVGSICASRWLSGASIILVMINYHSFRTKLATIPLSVAFPDCDDNNHDDPKAALDVVCAQFRKSMPESANMHPYVCEHDLPVTPKIANVIMDTVLWHSVKPVCCFGSGPLKAEIHKPAFEEAP